MWNILRDENKEKNKSCKIIKNINLQYKNSFNNINRDIGKMFRNVNIFESLEIEETIDSEQENFQERGYGKLRENG
jgi:3-deoxy-D-manno-octulosonic acid (KDO) 8-phosphate synthase